jgi:hypothetical protein
VRFMLPFVDQLQIKIIRRIFVVLFVLLLNGCSSITAHYYYAPSNPNNWKTSGCRDYHSVSYGFTCGETTYWVCPELNHHINWVGPPIFPFILPGFLFEKDPNPISSALNLRIYVHDELTKPDIVWPSIKLSSGEVISPVSCDNWVRSFDHSYQKSSCRYPILVWDLPTFSLAVDTNELKCSPVPLEFVQKQGYRYDPLTFFIH